MSIVRHLSRTVRALTGVLVAVALGVVLADDATAQKWPEKTVRIVLPFTTGGGTDRTSRILASRFSDALGQQFFVDNRPGAGSTVGTEFVAKAPPDGYTLLVCSSAFVSSSILYPKLAYDPIKDFAPVSLVMTVPHVIVVHPSLPVKNLQELVRLARAKPGQVMYATAGPGSAVHLAGALFAATTKIELTQVPYKGGGFMMTALLGGEVPVLFATIEAILPSIRGNRLRAIAVSTRERTPMLPDVPTAIESGFRNYEVMSWVGLLAPAGTPAAIVERLSAEVAKVMSAPETRELFTQEGATPVGGKPAQFGEFLRAEVAKWTPIIREAGIKLD